jgi:hypothetical protein
MWTLSCRLVTSVSTVAQLAEEAAVHVIDRIAGPSANSTHTHFRDVDCDFEAAASAAVLSGSGVCDTKTRLLHLPAAT